MNGHMTKKLSEVDAWSNKWHKTYQNVNFSTFRQFFFFAQKLKKNFFRTNFDGLVVKPETRLFFFLGLIY